MCDDECRPQSQGDLIGKIPWLQERKHTSTPIAESPLGKRYFRVLFSGYSLDTFEVIRTFAAAFPSYLPKRYHTMDCDTIRRNSEKGAYWANALHFSNACINHGTQPYYNLMHRKSPGTERAQINAEQLQAMGGPEVCGAAAEFLLEPWVLLQLPFQPALLHQWAVAALAENLKYCRHIMEITTKGFAPVLTDLIGKLITIASNLENHCQTFIAHFFLTYCKTTNVNIQVKAKKIFDLKFFEQLAETLAALEFIMSDLCTDIFNFIKRTSWSAKYPPSGLTSYKLFEEPLPGCQSPTPQYNLFGKYSSVYTIKHWQVGKMVRLCDPAREVEVMSRIGRIGSLKSRRLHEKMGADTSFIDPVQLQPCVEDFKIFASQHVLTDGHLKGVDDPEKLIDKIMESQSLMEKYTLLVPNFEFLQHNIGFGSTSPASTDGGVIQQIFNLRSDLKALGGDGTITRKIWNAATKLDKKVYLDASDLPVPEGFTREDCMLKIDENLARKDQWLLQQIFEKAQLSLDKVCADNFTIRIRTLVLQMYKKQYATCNAIPFHYYPECHLVQYVLPCLVAMLFDVQEDSQLSAESKEDFKIFVDEVIKSYEQQEFVQLLLRAKKRNLHSPLNPVLQNVYSALSSKLENSLEMQTNLKNLVLGLKFLDSEYFGTKLNYADVDSEYPLYMLFRRMEVCLEKVGWISRSKDLELGNIIPIFSQIKNKISDVDKDLLRRLATLSASLTDPQNLSTHQLFGIAVFQTMNTRMNQEKFESTFQLPFFPLDPCPTLVSKILGRDWWGLREIFTPLLGRPCDALDLIPWNQAKNSQRCHALINSLSTDKAVKMSCPGEITFFPIQHCRWCGLAKARHLQLCSECKDEPDFPLPNYYCSGECEAKAMEACHSEEHARFVMMKMGIWE